MECRSLETAVVGHDGFVAEHDRGFDGGVAADVAISTENRAAEDHLRSDPAVGPDNRSIDDRHLLDVRLATDHRVGEDLDTRLQYRPFIDEAGLLQLDAGVDARV